MENIWKLPIIFNSYVNWILIQKHSQIISEIFPSLSHFIIKFSQHIDKEKEWKHLTSLGPSCLYSWPSTWLVLLHESPYLKPQFRILTIRRLDHDIRVVTIEASEKQCNSPGLRKLSQTNDPKESTFCWTTQAFKSILLRYSWTKEPR